MGQKNETYYPQGNYSYSNMNTPTNQGNYSHGNNGMGVLNYNSASQK
jgi:hypothetical protein